MNQTEQNAMVKGFTDALYRDLVDTLGEPQSEHAENSAKNSIQQYLELAIYRVTHPTNGQ